MQNGKGLAIILPGIGYHKDKPLLYYAAKMVQQKGYDTVFVTYQNMPDKIRGDIDMMRKAASLAYEQTAERLENVAFSESKDILFIGKSIGTAAMARYLSESGLEARQIWYTPVEATFSYGSKGALAFIGEEDPWSDVKWVQARAGEDGVQLYTYPRCNHSLECEDVKQNLDILCDVMNKTAEYISS